MENIDSIVELSHVGIQENNTATFYIHGNYDQPGSKVVMVFIIVQINQIRLLALQANDILEMMQSFPTANISIRNSSSSRLPPASAQSFLREDSSISTVVIGDYDKQYNNK